MSTDFVLSDKVSARELFGGRLDNCGIREHVSPETHERWRCLTDGRNYLWVYINEDGLVGCLSRYGANAPGKILRSIAEEFDTQIFSEYQPQFWGFDTQEQWDSAMKEMADRDRNEFYVDVCAYVRGEPNNISRGTIGEIEAEIAKKLVEKDPALMQPENKEKLLAAMQAIYTKDHAVVIQLGPEDVAFVQMLATHEDDLPQA
jgi:hypothetical protein